MNEESNVIIEVHMNLVGCKDEVDTSVTVEEWKEMSWQQQSEVIQECLEEIIECVPVDEDGNIID